MDTFPHRLDRTIVIKARPETVFGFFTDDKRWAAWWGAGSTIDARRGGHVLIRFPGGNEVTGEVLEIAAPLRLVFTYGFTSGTKVPPGSSRVTLRLENLAGATRLHLSHEFADAAARDEHVQGWRYQLALFGNVVADEQHAGAALTVDEWFRAWSEPREACAATLARVAAPDVRFRDRFSLTDGLDDLRAHIEAAQRFMPGLRMQRVGGVRQCQGTVIADWVAQGPDGQPRGQGTNVFVLDALGRIESATGFWALPAGLAAGGDTKP